MTAGVGLSGDLANPRRSIPLGTLAETLTGMVVYEVAMLVAVRRRIAQDRQTPAWTWTVNVIA